MLFSPLGFDYTMLAKMCAFMLLVVFALIQHTTSQAADCTPKHVVDIKLDTDHYLTWSVQETEVCDLSGFLVFIFNRNSSSEYVLTVSEPRLDVSFLGVCQQWTFVVVAISPVFNMGPEQRLVTTLPFPTNANLTITSINITRMGPLMERHLEWDLEDSHLGSCSLQYRFTVEIEGNPIIEDMYLTDKFINLRFLSPCANYLFGVRAINVGFPTIEGPMRQQSYYISPDRQGAPRLLSVTPTYNGFNSTWSIESAERNACAIRSFYLDGGVLFRETVTLDETDGREPINVTVTGLRPNTMYYFKAYLINTVGYSQPASVAIQTLNFTED